MSTCPELDLLSVYIDKELPRQYEQKLEEHLSTCSECKNQLNKMQFLHSTLQEDVCAISFSDSELDESFLRLKTKMNYKSVTTPTGFQFSSFARWSMPVITAAKIPPPVILKNSWLSGAKSKITCWPFGRSSSAKCGLFPVPTETNLRSSRLWISCATMAASI